MTESQNTEWKESWRDEYLKWICGFANAQGGKIYIGVDDSGKVVGVKNIKRLLEDIPNKIQTTLGIVADVNRLTEDGKDYIEITVSPSNFPVNYNGEYHYRSGGTKQQLRGIALTDFLSAKTGIRWEDVPVPGVSVNDLDKDSFDIFRREALRSKRMTKEDLRMSNDELLDSLGLKTPSGLKRAAILLFHRNPEKWFIGCYTKIGRFGKGSDLQYQDEVHGSLFLQADRVVDLIYLKYLKAPITYDNMTRVETYPYPKDAVREALYNALIHSCWFSGAPIQIRIEDDAMYISNDCVFPSDWTAETLMHRHRSRPYNPNIANAFFRAGYVESWGRGIQKICENCEAYGTALPEYIVHSEDIMVKLTALQNPKASNFGVSKDQNELLDESKAPKIQKVSKPYSLDLELTLSLIKLVKNEPELSQSEIAEKLGVTRRVVQKIMTSLSNDGQIERVGGKRYGRWIVH